MMEECKLPNGETLSYREYYPQLKGHAPTALFVHGNFSSHIWWDDIIASLPKTNHTLSVDLRGFGHSTYNSRCMNFKEWAQDLRLLCFELKIQSVLAIGMSFGGGVVMRLAQSAPNMVKGVFLTSSVSHQGLQLSPPASTQAQIREQPKAKFMLNVLQDRNLQAMRQVYEALLFCKMDHCSAETKAKLVATAFQQRCYVDLLGALSHSDIDMTLIKCPLHMIHGDEDRVVTFNSVRSLSTLTAHFQVWKGHQHMLPFQDPARYLLSLTSFLTPL